MIILNGSGSKDDWMDGNQNADHLRRGPICCSSSSDLNQIPLRSKTVLNNGRYQVGAESHRLPDDSFLGREDFSSHYHYVGLRLLGYRPVWPHDGRSESKGVL